MRSSAALRGGLLVLAVFIAGPTGAAAETTTITTLVGTGATTFQGDGGLGPAANLNAPTGLAWHPDGSILIAEYGGHRIRRYDPVTRYVSTFLGTGTAGGAGDGGALTAATVSGPRDIAFAPGGTSTDYTMYISEWTGARIRRVHMTAGTPVLSTVAGNGTAGYAGDGAAASTAQFTSPAQLSVAPNGDLFIADSGNHRIRKIEAGVDGIVDTTDTITTVAGTGTSGLSGDLGVASAAALASPQGVLANSDGTLVIADTGNHRIRKLALDGAVITGNSIITTQYGSSQCASATGLCGDGALGSIATFRSPFSVIADQPIAAGGTWGFPASAPYGYVIADTSSNRVRRITAGGMTSTLIGTGTTCTATDRCNDGGPAEMANLTSPYDVLVGADGTSFYEADANNRLRVRRVDAGSVGPVGPTGPTGPTGATGATGPAGATGSTGSPGAPGATGPAGAAGADGFDGADGADGAQGPAGASGADGAAGASGPAGRDGQRGTKGDTGPAGTQGATGPALPLMVSLPASRVTVKARSHTILRIFVSGPAKVTVTVSRNSRTVRRITRSFETIGRRSIDLGRLGRGRYKVTVMGRRGGEVAADKATLVAR